MVDVPTRTLLDYLNSLPSGGTGGVVTRDLTIRGDIPTAEQAVPPGGTSGEVLVKLSNDDFSTGWSPVQVDGLIISEELAPNWQSGKSGSPNRVVIGVPAYTAPDLAEENAKSVVAIGSGAMFSATSATRAIAIGENALGNVAAVGFSNIAVGDFALSSASGHRNIGVGTLAGHFISTGTYNNLLGRDSGHGITTGTHNNAFGYRAVSVGYNPVGLNGVIENQYTGGDNTFRNAGFGTSTLEFITEYNNVAFGDFAGRYIRASRGNTYLGVRAGEGHGYYVSENDKVLDRTVRTGTYSQTGTTITVSVAGHSAVAGNKIEITFTSGALASDTNGDAQWLAVAGVTDADTLTLTSPVSKTASGNVSIAVVETAATADPGDFNTIIGYMAGLTFRRGSRNVLIGLEAGEGSAWNQTEYSDRLLIHNLSTRRPLIAGDFANGRVAINGVNSDLSQWFSVHNPTTGARSFYIGTDGNTYVSGPGYADTPLTGVQGNLNIVGGSGAGATVARFTANGTSATVRFLKSRSATPGSFAALQNNDEIGNFNFFGDDGTDYNNPAASIYAFVNGTVATNSIPGRLSFRTTAVGGTSSTERMVIYADGGVTIGSATGASQGAGTLNMDNAIYRDGVQVVGTRQTGWSAATGTATRTTFDTSTVTLPDLAERVKALIDDLTTHGLIGA